MVFLSLISRRASLANLLAKIVIIFLPISLNMCFGCSKEPSHRDYSFEYPQHMFLLRRARLQPFNGEKCDNLRLCMQRKLLDKYCTVDVVE